jgi:hypothetical protein
MKGYGVFLDSGIFIAFPEVWGTDQDLAIEGASVIPGGV